MRALASLFLAISSGRSIAALCRGEDLAQSLDSVWSKEFMAAGRYCLANVTPQTHMSAGPQPSSNSVKGSVVRNLVRGSRPRRSWLEPASEPIADR